MVEVDNGLDKWETKTEAGFVAAGVGAEESCEDFGKGFFGNADARV